jgi:hypothetical protein
MTSGGLFQIRCWHCGKRGEAAKSLVESGQRMDDSDSTWCAIRPHDCRVMPCKVYYWYCPHCQFELDHYLDGEMYRRRVKRALGWIGGSFGQPLIDPATIKPPAPKPQMTLF